MAATLKTDVVGNKTDTTANLTLGSSGATTFGGAVTVTSGTINGTTIGASSAVAGTFSNVVATNIQATGGQTLSIKEDSGGAVITVDTSGNVAIDPGSTLTLGEAGDNTISGTPSGAGEDRHSGQTIELQGKVTGVGYQSGLTSSSAARGVGVMYAGITGEIKMYGGTYSPEGWVLCDGSNYDGTAGTAYKNLFDILGTAYGDGDGTSNDFNVPDMRGRVPMGVGTGKGKDSADTDGGSDPATASATTLTARERGEFGGFESVTLTSAQSGVPAHVHTQTGTFTSGNSPDLTHASHEHTFGVQSDPNTGAFGGPYYRGNSASSVRIPGATVPSHGTHTHTTTISGSTANNSTANAGSSHSNEMPFMCVNYIIKL